MTRLPAPSNSRIDDLLPHNCYPVC
ncbi:hypothetical protein [Variovorax paradoxus]